MIMSKTSGKPISKLAELFKKIMEALFGSKKERGGPGGPGPEGPMPVDVELMQSLDGMIQDISRLKEAALEEGDFLKSYMIEAQLQALTEVKSVLNHPESGVSDMSEIAERTDAIMKGKMAELAEDPKYKELLSDYMAFDPKNIKAKEAETMKDVASITAKYNLGSKGNSINSLMKESSKVSVGILKNADLNKKVEKKDTAPSPERTAATSPTDTTKTKSNLHIITEGKLSSVQLDLIERRQEQVKNNDLEGAVATEFQRVVLMKFGDPSLTASAQNELKEVYNISEDEMMSSAINTVAFNNNHYNQTKNYDGTVAELKESTKNEGFSNHQQDAKSFISEKVSELNFDGIETKIIEQIDESIGKTINTTVESTPTKDPEKEKEKEAEEADMVM